MNNNKQPCDFIVRRSKINITATFKDNNNAETTESPQKYRLDDFRSRDAIYEQNGIKGIGPAAAALDGFK